MELIKHKNARMLQRSALFLIFAGILIGIVGFSGQNYASVFLGFSFAVLSLICYLCIEFGKILLAKILWGFGTPILLFTAPYFFTLQQPVTIISYSFAYAAGLLYCTYSFRGAEEQKYLWSTVVLFFICFMFYDQIMIAKSFSNSPYVKIFIDHFWYFKMYQIIHFASLVYLVHIIVINKLEVEASLQNRIAKLHKFVNNLITTSKNRLLYSGDTLNALKEIMLHTSQVVDVSRVSVWEYDEDGSTIKLVTGYDSVNKEYFSDYSLESVMYPQYFHYLKEEKIIMANDAVNDFRTREFAESYLVPLNIKSMMDAPFFLDGKLRGVLCFEEQRLYRTWDQMDQLFSMSMSKLISIAYYCTIRREQFDELVLTSNNLKLKNETILKVNAKFREINSALNETIQDKRGEEESLKKWIEEMAYKNSHHVRGPLSRILGLVELYKSDSNIENRMQYITYIEKSSQELDQVITEINDLLNKG